MPLDLQGKIGPLPAWAWGGLIGIAVVGFSYMHRSNSAAVAAGDGAVPVAIDGVDGAFGGASGGTSPIDDGTVPVSQDPADFSGVLPDYSGVDFQDKTSLETWVARAVLWLSGQGVSPPKAQDAISNYLSGTSDPAGESIVQQAVMHFGAPPLGVDPTGVSLVGTPDWEARTPDNTPMPPPLPGLNRYWDYTSKQWYYHKPFPKSTAAKPVATGTHKYPTPTTPLPAPREGWSRQWDKDAGHWTYYNPTTKARVNA